MVIKIIYMHDSHVVHVRDLVSCHADAKQILGHYYPNNNPHKLSLRYSTFSLTLLFYHISLHALTLHTNILFSQ